MAVVEQAAAAGEVDAGHLVLAPVAADADAEDEPAAGEQLDRRGLLGHRGRPA
jgi:hypothetical protein